MGHDIHFLSRLERLSLPHVEQAMSLYNDTPLLRYVLDNLKLPEGAERIALSLGDSTQGPFLILQREGHFVTCLGEGMAPVGLHVVPRSHVEALTQRVQGRRQRLELAEKQLGPHGQTVDLFRPLLNAGPNLSREEFVAAAAWAPLMLPELIRLIGELHNDLVQTYHIVRPKQKRRVADPALLRDYWNTIWATGHLALLVGMEGRELCEKILAARQDAASLVAKFSWPAVFHAICGPALRGAWAAGKLGKVLLPAYKAEYAQGGSDLSFYLVVLSLFSIAGRHKGLRGEIRKTLERTDPLQGSKQPGRLYKNIAPHLAKFFVASMQTADNTPEALIRYGQYIYFEKLQLHLPEDSAFRYKDPLEIPPEIAAPAAAMMPSNILADVQSLPVLLGVNVWLSGLDAEALYFPRSMLQELHLPFMPQLVHLQIDEMEKLCGDDIPIRATAVPGRNEPCPCGSNIKYKKCCARTGSAAPVQPAR